MSTADAADAGAAGAAAGDKRALLARLLAERARAPRRHPASFGQRRLWFLDRLTGADPVYNIPVAFRVRGPLDVDALRTALATIVARHGALRTTFAESGGEPVQVVHPTGVPDLAVVDLTGLPAADRDAEATRLVWEQARTPFDLTAGPLLRVVVVRTDTDRHHLSLCLHHIVSDAWSLGVLFRELDTAYAAALAGEPARLPELPTQYADFAVWQRDRLAGDTLRGQLDHWLAHLRGAPALLSLPTDRPRPTSRSQRGAAHYLTLPAEVTSRVEEFGRTAGVTLFMTLLAGFQAVLSRHSGQDDIVVGTPVAGRDHPDLEGLIGFFVNTVALRVSTAGSPSLRELVGRVREVALTGLGNAELPFEKLVEELQPDRSLAHAPVFQAQLVLQNAPYDGFRLTGCTASTLEVDSGSAKFDLTLVGERTGDGALRLAFEYDTALFDVATVDRLGRHLCTLLAAAVADPDRPLDRIPLLGGAELRQALVEWNATDRPLPEVSSVLDLLPTGPAAPGSPPAVTGPDGQLDRPDLHRWAGRIARRLRAAGVGPDTPVGICLDRGVGMVAAVLGVWRAGAGYLPLDPALPAERLRFMLADSGARVVLTSRAVADRLAGVLDAAPTVLLLDDTGAHTGTSGTVDDAAGTDEPDPAAPHPDALAYLLYTSGSTGRPKGVAVPHRAVLNLLTSFRADLDLGPGDLLAAVTTLSFDISVVELVLPLMCDVPLLVVGADETADGPALRRRLAESGTTVLQATPATWRLLLAAGGVPPTVRLRLTGGEALPRDLADALLADGASLWNCYGPTETTVYSSAGPVPPAPAVVTIGRPIANTRLHLLDEAFQPVPVGVVGELYVGGTGVARGYHGRPGLTADRFVPDPFADRPGARLYATGDLARRRPDGTVEYLGRADHQVKVRGFRIEPGEIETLLRARDEVADAVVTAWTGGDGDVRLVAYAVPAAGTDPDSLWERVRPALACRLPEYMVPATLVPLAALPLTDSGKVDRKALPAPRWTDSAAVPVAPRDPVERLVAEIWQDVLRVDAVGVHDDFFRLGGHSLLGVRALGRIGAAVEMEVPIPLLFAAPTVAAMADALRAAEPTPGHVDAVAAFRQEMAGLSDEELRALVEGPS
ncbi:non-ribosomal peptide synthetase [Micromonospora echinospora]|uniref:Amino acid adenylation domain-containing protein n=1 Tax=Micromonospora echinospora TaxID=1877 RepID=A0A1C4Z9U3_MICEC|nr:non-ribosomal peptide synthetase [Micromonospora echinospora]OZV80550.1 non-ribosomal peptide synthetase [Micromonospora echinospora]SCF29709.1 amino acid adenylation domain-containing protein [Micromonospora echinospora]